MDASTLLLKTTWWRKPRLCSMVTWMKGPVGHSLALVEEVLPSLKVEQLASFCQWHRMGERSGCYHIFLCHGQLWVKVNDEDSKSTFWKKKTLEWTNGKTGKATIQPELECPGCHSRIILCAVLMPWFICMAAWGIKNQYLRVIHVGMTCICQSFEVSQK